MALSRTHLPSITAGSRSESLGTLRGIKKKRGKMPCMQDASPTPDLGFLYFAVHCDTFWCNSISIFLLHFKVAENNTLNGKMKYVLSPACYLSPPLPPPLPAYIHTSFNSNRKSKRREKEKVPSLSIFSCVPSVINHWAFSLHQDRFHLHMPQHPSWDSDNTLMFCAE